MDQKTAETQLQGLIDQKKAELEVLVDLLTQWRSGDEVKGVLIEHTLVIREVRQQGEYGGRESKLLLASRNVFGEDRSGGPPPAPSRLFVPGDVSVPALRGAA